MFALALTRGMAFLLGFGFTLLPNAAPFVAILAAFSQAPRLRRGDLYWIGGALLLATPLIAVGGWLPAAAGTAEALAAWLLYRTFMGLPGRSSGALDARDVGVGMLAGFATVIAVGGAHLGGGAPLAHLSQALVWDNAPNLFAHSVLVLGLLIAVLIPMAPIRTIALALSAVGITLAGSRDGALAWTVATFLLLLVSPARRAPTKVAEYALLAGLVIVLAGTAPAFGFARLSFLFGQAPGANGTNLLHGTEAPGSTWWFHQGVSVNASKERVGARELMAYSVTKQGPERWRRLQQTVTLYPGATYTLSAWLRSVSAPNVPGLEGWGDRSADSLGLVGSLADGTWRARLTGNGALLASGEKITGQWTRVWATFQYDGAHPLYLWVGFSPDVRAHAGTSATMAGLQLERGAGPSAYVPGTATGGLRLAAEALLPYWRVAWHGFLARPWLGHSRTPFSRYFNGAQRQTASFEEMPAHAHDLILQVLYQRGLVGFLGLAMLLYALGRASIRRRDLPMLVVIVGILIANVFDYTLFFGGVIYPLAAVAGWRSTAAQPVRGVADQRARATLVRLTLAVSDLGAAAAALGLSLLVRNGLTGSFGLRPLTGHVPDALLYAFLLWPALSLREGLYPGYGVKAPQELRRGVYASLQAGLLLVAGSVLFARSLPVARSLLVLMVVIALLTGPIARAIAKRVLMRLGAWGRDVVILGGGATAERVVSSLRRAPIAGLRPVAVFDDDPENLGALVGGLRVEGTLADAKHFAGRNGISHAIVAMPELSPSALAAVVEQSTSSFRRVQFVPELPGMPTEDVFASELDEMLALEIRGGLYAPGNQVAKRLIDLVGGVALTVLTSPILAGLYLWVRLDSRGPAFHRSERVGQGGTAFRCLKFRTMYVDAEERLSELLASDPALAAEYATFHKLQNDPRITRAGRFLRKTSLDELPQLLNVILGQMSLVGPRPYLAREMPEIGAYADILFRAKPGITGFWQVSARNEVTFEERLMMESHYVRNWSIWWDIILLVQTPAVVLDGRGAK